MVKTYNRPAMRKLGNAEVFLTVSSSNPIQRHMTAVLESPLVLKSGMYDSVCSCMGWTRHKHCWHTDQAEETASVQMNFYDAVALLQLIQRRIMTGQDPMTPEIDSNIEDLVALLPDLDEEE